MATPSPTSPDEAKKRGQSARELAPRKSLATLAPRPDSYDPVARLMWQGESRRSDLLSLRYTRMLASPLAFYRGNALLMAEDLARGMNTPLEVQICGDAHLSNFNLFTSPEGRSVFDVNDFDETDHGPFEWDVKRLVSSLCLASSQLGHSEIQQHHIATSAAYEYRQSIRRFADENRLAVWYATLDIDATAQDLKGFFTESALHRVNMVVAKAVGRNQQRAFAKLIVEKRDGLRIVTHPPLLVPLSQLVGSGYLTAIELERVIAGYTKTLSSDRQVLLSQFTPLDSARKVVGVGSVGTECYITLFEGRDEFDPFFLQVKQAADSVIATALGRASAVPGGQRVVDGQRLMQTTPDVFLGWHSLKLEGVSRHYYVRQLYDNKAAIAIDGLNEQLLVTYGRICAWTLARAHARSGRGAEIAGYLGKSDVADEAFATFALAYRDRTLSDFKSLQSATKDGRITLTR
ncbi:MAG: DUF2252 domain-containing protein [Acidimicrobiales bacterium]